MPFEEVKAMAKKSDTGVYQLKDGNWGFRFKVVVGGVPVYRKCSKDEFGNPFLNKRAAISGRERAIKAEKTQAGEKYIPRKEVIPAAGTAKTVEEVYNEYCEKGRKDRAYNTKRKQDSIWVNHLCARFGKRWIDDISTAEIQDYLSSLYYEDGFSFMYVESFLKMFYLIFGQAYSRGYLDTSVYNRLCTNRDTKIHMPKKKVDEDEDISIFTQEELTVMDAYFRGTNAETAYLLGRFCGLRINECYGLKWDQIDLEKGTIRIEQQMQYQNGLIKLVPLKTRNARRTVFMCEKLKEYFRGLKEQRDRISPEQAQVRQQNQRFIIDTNGEALSSLELVNCLPNGKIQTVNSMKYHSRTLKSEYGIEFKYHYLRHTYGMHLATLNTPAHILCNQMGHGKIETTKKYYITVSKNGINVLMNNLNQM